MKSYSKKRKILYNAPVDWEARPENLVIAKMGSLMRHRWY